MQMTSNNDNQQREERESIRDDRRRNIFVWASEAALVAGCAVIFVAFLVALIGVYFPAGMALVGDQPENEFGAISSTGEVVLGVGSQTQTTKRIFAGEIVRISRRVQRRRAKSLAWNTASVGDEVTRNDAVQTFARSVALLAVNKRSHLSIGENSLIVFDEQESDPFLRSQQGVIVMMAGELSGSVSSEDKSNFQFGVNLPNSEVTLLPETPGDKVEFLITVNDDNSTTVNLHRGSAHIVGRDGQRQTIGALDSITIDATGTDMRISKLPAVPESIGPGTSASVRYRNVPKEVTFEWEPVNQADRYHIIVARDPELTDRVVDDDVVGTTFTHGALGAGTYYWQVRSRAAWSQSGMSASRRIRVIQDRDAPLLELDPPPETVSTGSWRLSGRTDADAAVYIDGIEVAHDGGRIDEAVELQPGANIITVKAMDDVGNLRYASVSINAK